MDKIERYQGSLMGLAVGDALGTTLEFTRPGTFTPINDMVGGGPFNLKPGEWTDDTSMALCLATSLIECSGFNPVDQMQRYLRWYREGYLSSTGHCFDIGNTVRTALLRFEETGEPYSGSIDPNSAGNGSIMRLTPVPLFYAHDSVEAIKRSACSSRTTHGAPAAVDACRYLSALIIGAVQGETKDRLLEPHYTMVPGYWEKYPLFSAIDRIAVGSFRRKEPPEIRGTGYVVQSLEAALWAFFKAKSFEEGIFLSVNLGEDADTTGAIYGQLAGAYYGIYSIPENLRDRIACKQLILDCAKGIYDLSISEPNNSH